MPENDFKIYEAEYADPEGHLVGISSFCLALKAVQVLVATAKRSGGTWTNKEILRRR
jgi:hypothetical protein